MIDVKLTRLQELVFLKFNDTNWHVKEDFDLITISNSSFWNIIKVLEKKGLVLSRYNPKLNNSSFMKKEVCLTDTGINELEFRRQELKEVDELDKLELDELKRMIRKLKAQNISYKDFFTELKNQMEDSKAIFLIPIKEHVAKFCSNVLRGN